MQEGQPVKISYISRIESVLKHPKVIKLCLYSVILAWALALGGGYLFAQLNPAGYSLFKNYISDLGSLQYTPLPKFLDDGLMLAGVFMIPAVLYFRQILSPAGDTNRFRKILSNIILFLYMSGSIGIFFTGVISEDVGARWDALWRMPFPDEPWHDFPADVAFYSFICNGFLIFLLLELYPSILEKQMGIVHKGGLTIRILLGIDVYILSPVLFVIFSMSYPDKFMFGMYSSFWEWSLVLSYIVWQLPLFGLLIRTLRWSSQTGAIESS